MRRPGTILLLAIVIGALGAAMVYRYLRRQQTEIELAQREVGALEVVVASETIPIGAKIQLNQLKQVRWPVGAEPEGAFHTTAAVVGGTARTTIEKNQPLQPSHLVTGGAGLLPLLITEGMRGMSVKVDNVTGVSGFITPNSHVDVLAAGTPEAGGAAGGRTTLRSKLILQNVKVLATGTTIEQRDNKPVEVPTVTLLVSPQDAEKLTLATRGEPVRLALRNYQDDEFVATEGMSLAVLFGEESKPAPPPPPAIRVAAPRVAKPQRQVERRREPRYSVEVLLGDKVTRQDLY